MFSECVVTVLSQIVATDPFRLDAKFAEALGLKLSEDKLQLIGAAVASRLVSPCEAAMIMLG